MEMKQGYNALSQRPALPWLGMEVCNCPKGVQDRLALIWDIAEGLRNN